MRGFPDGIVGSHEHPNVPYQGNFNRKLFFEEIDGFNVMSLDYNVVLGAEFAVKTIANLTVVLVASS